MSLLFPAAFMLLVVACGGSSQIADTPTAEAEVVAKVDLEPSPTKEPPKPEPTNPPAPTEVAPSATPTPLPTATSTPVPPAPTAIATPVPTSTAMPIPTNTPTATSTQIPSTATPTPTPSQMGLLGTPPSPSIFSLSTTYDAFANDLQSAFKSAVDVEFNAAHEKAGISVAVYTDGTLWTYATGRADESVELTADTPILIGSTSKTFLSALILTQLESGLYKITDSLGTVLSNHPDFPSFAPDKINPEVTIQEMLTMSSGLPDFNENRQGLSEIFKKPLWKPSDNINLAQSQFVVPGTFKYNDTNLVLLGLIAEFYAGQDLADLYRQTFLDPLGITAIILPEEGIPWHPDIFSDQGDQLTVPSIAMPYGDLSSWSSGFGNIVQAAPFEFGYYIVGQGRIRWACCGIVSTPENMARWAYELYSPNGSAISESAQVHLLNSFSDKRVPDWGDKDIYGYFVAKRTFQLPSSRVVTAYGHPGGGGGYSSFMRYSPELDLSISILANSELKFRGACRGEKPFDCIASAIFAAYSNILQPTAQ